MSTLACAPLPSYKITRRSPFAGLVFVASIALIGIIIAALYRPPRIGTVGALETEIALGVSTVLSVNIAPYEGIRLPINPTASGAYTARKLSIDVATNNSFGFTATMSAGPSIDGETPGSHLVNLAGNLPEPPTLPPTSGTLLAPAVLSRNSWGYAVPLDQTGDSGLLPGITTPGFDGAYTEASSVSELNENYAAIPEDTSSAVTLKTTNGSTISDQTEVFFGSMMTSGVPSGNYAGTIVFSVVANYARPAPPSTMQGMTETYCDSMNHGDTLNLLDTRDSRSYTIVKVGGPGSPNWTSGMAPGKCWMADNLALDGPLTLYPSDTDIPSGVSSWSLPESILSSDPSSNEEPQWLPANAVNRNDYCAPYGSVECGNLYNWYAATAGTGTTSLSGGEATASICPMGWILPSGGADGDFVALDIALGGDGTNGGRESVLYLTGEPLSLPLNGSFFYGLGYQGEFANYWSRTGGNSGYAYALRFSQSSVDPRGYDESKNSYGVRCILGAR